MAKKPKFTKADASTSTERRAAALRENLRRRKSQQRLRSATVPARKAPVKDDGEP